MHAKGQRGITPRAAVGRHHHFFVCRRPQLTCIVIPFPFVVGFIGMLTRCREFWQAATKACVRCSQQPKMRSTQRQLTAAVARCLVPPIISLTVVACGDDSGPTAPAARTPRETAPVAIEYLNSALDFMQENSLKRLEIDWPTFRARRSGFAQGLRLRGDLRRNRFALSALEEITTAFVPAGQTPPVAFPHRGHPAGRTLAALVTSSCRAFSPRTSTMLWRLATRGECRSSFVLWTVRVDAVGLWTSGPTGGGTCGRWWLE
jgi:hypothetical protein